MKWYVKAAHEASRGVFWIIDGELYAFPFYSGYDNGIAKSGNTYNHKKLWPEIKPDKCNKPFDYYPRGRVDFTGSGQSIIYMNPNIDDSYIPKIKQAFGLRDTPKVHYDFSEHYHCYLDSPSQNNKHSKKSKEKTKK